MKNSFESNVGKKIMKMINDLAHYLYLVNYPKKYFLKNHWDSNWFTKNDIDIVCYYQS